MPYKRPIVQKQTMPHKVYDEWGHLGQLSDHEAGWVYPHIVDMLDEARLSLAQFSSVIAQVNAMDVSEYKKSIAQEKKNKMILAARRALMGFLKRPIEKYRSDVAAIGNVILRVTEPDRPNDPMKLMLQEMRFREIRDNLKNIEPKRRREAIAGSLERLQAVIGNPDPSDVIIAADALKEMRRDYAFKQDPSLIEQERDAALLYKAVRAKAGEVNASAVKMLIQNKMDDLMPPTEHYALFTPESDHEKVLADNRIRAWDKQQAEIVRRKEFDEKYEGLNMQAGERAARISRGIQH
jgi:hypothetical protein